jgi:hypothetical protein
VSAGAALSLSFLWFAVFATCSLLGGCVYLFGRFPRPSPGEKAAATLVRSTLRAVPAQVPLPFSSRL